MLVGMQAAGQTILSVQAEDLCLSTVVKMLMIGLRLLPDGVLAGLHAPAFAGS